MNEPTNDEVRCAIVADLHNAKQALRNHLINVRRCNATNRWHSSRPERELELKVAVIDFEEELAAFDAQHPELKCITISPMSF